MKQKQKWQIDDLVYFLPVACETGEIPHMLRGRVEEIRRTEVRIKVQFTESSNLIWIKNEYCYGSAKELIDAVNDDLETQAYICDNPDQVDK